LSDDFSAALPGIANETNWPVSSARNLPANKDNARAIRFYGKHGFAYAGEDKNPASGIAVNRMA
jgi:ribosomal protein S18 acetylase RimI-like enzyme